MGGKAKRRREKNYLASHGGGNARLPPPPDHSDIDIVPSKLRKIMSFAGKKAFSNGVKKKNISAEKRQVSADELGGKSEKIKKNEDPDDDQHENTKEKKKKKRKRNQVNDLRFEESDKLVGTGIKRKERRKLRNEVRKKKRNGNKEEKILESLNHDIVRFGDVVQAPPKLLAVPRGSKITTQVGVGVASQQIQAAYQERLRIQAVESYRNRKGWTSRPGLDLNPPCLSIE